MYSYPRICKNIIKTMKLQDVNIKGLAKATGLHRDTIDKILKGQRNISLNSLMKISDALDTHIMAILESKPQG